MSEVLDLSADFAAMVDPEPPEVWLVAPPSDAWLRRRGHGFGASDMANVLVALGYRSDDVLSSSQKKKNTQPRRKGIPRVHRVFLEKAGLVAPLKVNLDPDSPIQLGSEREPELVRQWTEKIRRGTAGPDCALLDWEAVTYVEGEWPREVLPLVDREAPRLTATPDTLVRSIFGRLEAWDAKCSMRPYGDLTHEQIAAGVTPLREHHRIQVHAQMSVCSAERGGIVEGEGWSAKFRDLSGVPCGPIVSRGMDRSEDLIRELRAASVEGWARVEEARAAYRLAA